MKIIIIIFFGILIMPFFMIGFIYDFIYSGISEGVDCHKDLYDWITDKGEN